MPVYHIYDPFALGEEDQMFPDDISADTPEEAWRKATGVALEPGGEPFNVEDNIHELRILDVQDRSHVKGKAVKTEVTGWYMFHIQELS